MKENIQAMIVKIQQITDLLYQQKQAEAFQLFGVYLNELTIITEQFFTQKQQGILTTFDEQKYLQILKEAMNALESRDDVLLADILNYDLTEQLEEIITQL